MKFSFRCTSIYFFSFSNSDSQGGGCAIPHPFAPESSQTRGVDCSNLPGVHEVKCSSGACAVGHCKDGWHLSQQGDACEQIKSDANLGGANTRRSLKRMKHVRTPQPIDSSNRESEPILKRSLVNDRRSKSLGTKSTDWLDPTSPDTTSPSLSSAVSGHGIESTVANPELLGHSLDPEHTVEHQTH